MRRPRRRVYVCQKVPKEHWEWIYNEYASGQTAVQIRKKLREEKQVNASLETVYRLITQLQDIQITEIEAYIHNSVSSTFSNIERYRNWLEEKAIDTRMQKNLTNFLRVVDRLVDIAKLQLMSTALTKHFDRVEQIDEQRDKVIADLESKVENLTKAKIG